MTWVNVFQSSYPYKKGNTSIDHSFYSSKLIIRAGSVGSKPTWRRAAVIYPVFFVSGIGNVASAKKTTLYLDTQEIEFSSINSPYTISFDFFDWITNLTLTFWEFNNLEQLPLPKSIYDGGFFP